MPQNVLLNEMQEPISWIFRLIMFAVIGIMAAVSFNRIKSYKKAETENSLLNIVTGLPNINKLKLDLDKMVYEDKSFSLIGFKILNIDDVNHNLDYEIGNEAVIRAAKTFSSLVNNTVYSVLTNEFAAILPDCSVEQALIIGGQYLDKMREPLSINKFNVDLIIKGGIVNYPTSIEEPCELIKKNGYCTWYERNEIGLYVYNNSVDKKSKERYKVIGCLLSAMKNNEFYIVYQPKLCLYDDSITSVEALLRWKRSFDLQINTDEFIKMAEDIGIISEITKWVIKTVILQGEKWQSEGLSINIALNISRKDLKDSSVINYLIDSIEKSTLEPSMIEIELTERVYLENEKKVMQLFHILTEHGFRISLDDFGTGYNSLIDLVRIPLDYIKIDKIFIDTISDINNRILVEALIDFAHKTGRKVIAEGVETKEQLDLLKCIGCDYIQGYYISKPMPPDDLTNFILSHENERESVITC